MARRRGRQHPCRWVALLALGIGLSAPLAGPAKAVECVPYARQVSSIKIKGNAWTWWDAARTQGFDRGATPRADAVMVFKRAKRMRVGHVAVVRRIVGPREIIIDHANWAPPGSRGRGRIDRGVSVIDVSAANDWSAVRVWYAAIDDYGQTVYPLYGFIYGRPDQTAADGADPVVPANAAPAVMRTVPLRDYSTTLVQGDKVVVMGHPVVSKGDPGATRKATERADRPRAQPSPSTAGRSTSGQSQLTVAAATVPPLALVGQRPAAPATDLPAVPARRPER